MDLVALKADIDSKPSVKADFDAGHTDPVVDHYATAGTPGPGQIDPGELRTKLRQNAITVTIRAAIYDGAALPETKAAVDLFFLFAQSQEPIERDDTAFSASVNQMVSVGLITSGQRDAIRALFVQPQTVGEELFGEVVTRAHIRKIRKDGI